MDDRSLPILLRFAICCSFVSTLHRSLSPFSSRRSSITSCALQFLLFAELRPSHWYKVQLNPVANRSGVILCSSWCLKLYPKGVNEKSVEYISLFVKYVRGRSDLQAKAEFSLINSRGEFHIVRKTPYHIFPTGGDWGYSEYLMRMVLTTQRKSELLNADQSLKIFTRVIIVGESSSSIIHEEKKNTYESLISLSSHLGSLLTSTKDNCHDVTIIVRPQQYNGLIYDNKSHDTPSASSSPIDGGKSSSKKNANNTGSGSNRTKRKRYSTNSGGSSGAGESSGENLNDETTSTALAIPSTPTTATFYAHRSILSVSVLIAILGINQRAFLPTSRFVVLSLLQCSPIRCSKIRILPSK